MNMARCALIESKLPYEFWPFAVNYATYTLNRLPTQRINWKTPFEAWSGTKPNITNMRPFGCTAYAHVDPSLRSSIEPTAIRCKFLGYAPYQKSFVLQQLDTKVIFVRRNVNFDENTIIGTSTEQHLSDPLGVSDDHEFVFYPTTNACETDNPHTYKQAMASKDANKWHQAALEELQAHHDNETWTLVDLPQNVKAVKSRWIFTTKTTPDGELRHKARFVAKGFSQQYGIDYKDTYSSVLAMASFRLLICIAINNDWKIHQKDFKTAYLNAPLLIPIYIEQPEGFVKHGGDNTRYAYLTKPCTVSNKQDAHGRKLSST